MVMQKEHTHTVGILSVFFEVMWITPVFFQMMCICGKWCCKFNYRWPSRATTVPGV